LKNAGDNNAAETTAAPQNSSEASETKTEAEADAKSGPIRRRPRTLDPIKWFGILVPPSLRNAQKSFTEAVEGSLPELAGIVVEMQAAEKEITELRRRMGRE
jgi:hypothetical protein